MSTRAVWAAALIVIVLAGEFVAGMVRELVGWP